MVRESNLATADKQIRQIQDGARNWVRRATRRSKGGLRTISPPFLLPPLWSTDFCPLPGGGRSGVLSGGSISRKAVEYHLGNIYAKCGLNGRQELRRFVGQWRQPAAV